MSDSAYGEDGGSFCFTSSSGSLFSVVRDDARLVEFEADDEVESSGISTTFHVWSVASGAKDTRRFALTISYVTAA